MATPIQNCSIRNFFTLIIFIIYNTINRKNPKVSYMKIVYMQYIRAKSFQYTVIMPTLHSQWSYGDLAPVFNNTGLLLGSNRLCSFLHSRVPSTHPVECSQGGGVRIQPIHTRKHGSECIHLFGECYQIFQCMRPNYCYQDLPLCSNSYLVVL